jgi:hypothetical protein
MWAPGRDAGARVRVSCVSIPRVAGSVLGSKEAAASNDGAGGFCPRGRESCGVGVNYRLSGRRLPAESRARLPTWGGPRPSSRRVSWDARSTSRHLGARPGNITGSSANPRGQCQIANLVASPSGSRNCSRVPFNPERPRARWCDNVVVRAKASLTRSNRPVPLAHQHPPSRRVSRARTPEQCVPA